MANGGLSNQGPKLPKIAGARPRLPTMPAAPRAPRVAGTTPRTPAGGLRMPKTAAPAPRVKMPKVGP